MLFDKQCSARENIGLGCNIVLCIVTNIFKFKD